MNLWVLRIKVFGILIFIQKIEEGMTDRVQAICLGHGNLLFAL